MTKKSNTKYLLLAVILIYGAIVVRFFMLRSDGDSTFIVDPIAQFTPKEYEVKEEFTIANNHRDPFLGKVPISGGQRKTTATKAVPTKKTDYFPSIQYQGIVSDASSSKKVISLLINDKEYIVREGKVADSVRVLRGNAKTLSVSYKGEIKKFNISQ